MSFPAAPPVVVTGRMRRLRSALRIIRRPVVGDDDAGQAALVPEYLKQTYHWAYLDPSNVRWLDRQLVVDSILWGNAARLMNAAVAECRVGEHVLQAACVYGDFSQRLLRRLGSDGRLTVVDAAPLQVANLRRKLAPRLASGGSLHATVADLAGDPVSVPGRPVDAVVCFFLLHELPTIARQRVVDRLLAQVPPGGRAVFVDYHRPARWHPLRPVMNWVFRRFEPFAQDFIRDDIRASAPTFDWHKTTYFGGLYQKLVAVRRT